MIYIINTFKIIKFINISFKNWVYNHCYYVPKFLPHFVSHMLYLINSILM